MHVHVEHSKASIFCQSFLCRREFSLAQGTPSQRGGFSHYHCLPLQFFHLVAGPTDLIDLDGSKADKGHIDCPKNLSIDWKEYSTFGKIESIRRWSLGVHFGGFPSFHIASTLGDQATCLQQQPHRLSARRAQQMQAQVQSQVPSVPSFSGPSDVCNNRLLGTKLFSLEKLENPEFWKQRMLYSMHERSLLKQMF